MNIGAIFNSIASIQHDFWRDFGGVDFDIDAGRFFQRSTKGVINAVYNGQNPVKAVLIHLL